MTVSVAVHPLTSRRIRCGRGSRALTSLIFGWFGTGLQTVLLFHSFATDLVENFAPLNGAFHSETIRPDA